MISTFEVPQFGHVIADSVIMDRCRVGADHDMPMHARTEANNPFVMAGECQPSMITGVRLCSWIAGTLRKLRARR